jgi:hypothetical protein
VTVQAADLRVQHTRRPQSEEISTPDHSICMHTCMQQAWVPIYHSWRDVRFAPSSTGTRLAPGHSRSTEAAIDGPHIVLREYAAMVRHKARCLYCCARRLSPVPVALGLPVLPACWLAGTSPAAGPRSGAPSCSTSRYSTVVTCSGLVRGQLPLLSQNYLLQLQGCRITAMGVRPVTALSW